MARLSDLIETMIREMIENNDGVIEVTRGELANLFHCVPSQITYVLQTRFTPNHGYNVESRRGGGGWIRIRQVAIGQGVSGFLMALIKGIDGPMSRHEIDVHLKNLVARGYLSPLLAHLMYAATSEQALYRVDASSKGEVRAHIFKCMLMQYLEDEAGSTTV